MLHGVHDCASVATLQDQFALHPQKFGDVPILLIALGSCKGLVDHHETLTRLSRQAQGFGVFAEEYDIVHAILNATELFHAFPELNQPFIETAAPDDLHAFEAMSPYSPKEEIIPRRIVQQRGHKRFKPAIIPRQDRNRTGGLEGAIQSDAG
jgi:hypothetical protein